ncbi:hypothetical protein [Lactococcus fujiensis]|uniref:Uncharacterized protein n=1 Tax=Lactococcus fujiensis JCM 16395 TaxID=1291764 RepID=A0A2A5RHW3_9LACT|nr:hypothetical protein [Lactococcus fujiensis]PCR98644.1 hypothetical protein RT41_GL001551 [Lactococcus fujiensis JCM 16395]
MTSKVEFDFTQIKKISVGEAIIKPTIHISVKGEIRFYSIDIRKTPYFRVAKTGSLVGFEFSEKPYENSFSTRRVSKINYTFSSSSKGIPQAIELSRNIGSKYYSANYPLRKDGENVYFFDITKPYKKYEKKAKGE